TMNGYQYRVVIGGTCTGATSNGTATLQLKQVPTATFSTAPAQACTNTDVTYTTQSGSGQNNYSWTFTGVAETDYHVVSGGNSSSATTVLHWITSGSKTATVNYNNSVG